MGFLGDGMRIDEVQLCFNGYLRLRPHLVAYPPDPYVFHVQDSWSRGEACLDLIDQIA